MRDVFISADNIYSPLGFTSLDNFNKLSAMISGIREHNNNLLSDIPFYASLFEDTDFNNAGLYTKFEQMLISSIGEALTHTAVPVKDDRTVMILSTTKGNISLLETEPDPLSKKEVFSLFHTAKKIASRYGFVHDPVVVSNACISGILAMIMGMRFIQSEQYDHVVVAGADVISKFVLSGFQSFQAISNGPCKPFDEARNGINLGEAAGTVILTSDPAFSKGLKLTGGSVSNDANHISGPSRTGEELFMTMNKAMKDAAVTAQEIGFISAHGTATIYNDEMEAKAIGLAGMQEVPVNSLKGFYGHTLGAAGLIESVLSCYSLLQGKIIPTLGFNTLGVSSPVNVNNKLRETASSHFLKTASGFGGCNAAIVVSKQ